MSMKRFGFLGETSLGTIIDTLMKMSARSQSCSGRVLAAEPHTCKEPRCFLGGLLWSQKPYRAVSHRGLNICCAQRVAY